MTTGIKMPERIGRFRLLSMLGRGAMGVVYKGHDEHIDRLVAIKLIRADLLDSEERENYFRRFRNEAQIAGRCVHANIVGLYDYSFHEGNPYLVMEYVNGCGLQQVSPRGTQRPLEEVLPIALQVLDALQYAHERGIVHRDVKPANILLTPQSRLKITDFGISRLSSSELTMTPLLIGTPSYMSPEQCMGAELDGRSDLFSLGCVLYELLAGRRPFVGINYTDTILGIINKPHTPLTEIRPDLPDGLSAVIDRALAKRPDTRFADADAFSHALDRFSAGTVRVPALPKALANAVADQQQAGSVVDETVLAPPLLHTGLPQVEVVPPPHPDSDDDTVLVPVDPTIRSESDVATHGVPDKAIDDLPEASVTPPAVTLPAEASLTEPVAQDAGEEIPGSTASEDPTAEISATAPHDIAAEAEPASEPVSGPAVAPDQPEQVHAWDGPPDIKASESETVFDHVAWQDWTTRCLTRIIGPIGPKVVARVWREDHPESLVDDCARFIRHDAERTDFLTLVHARGGAR